MKGEGRKEGRKGGRDEWEWRYSKMGRMVRERMMERERKLIQR